MRDGLAEALEKHEGTQRTFASSVPTSVYRFVNSICIGCIRSPEGASFGGVARESAPCTRDGVFCMLLVLVAVVAPDKLPKGDPAAGARGGFGVAPETTGGFVPNREPEPAMNLEFEADGASAIGSGFGMRLNAPGLSPANGLGAVAVTGFFASSAVDFVSGFGAAPREKPIKSGIGAAAEAAEEEEGLLFSGTPFVVNSGGVFGLAATGAAVAESSTKGSTLAKGGGGGIDPTSAGGGEGALPMLSHWPNGIFGDAGRGLSEVGFSPLTSSSSPPDTGVLARGELRTGRVLGLPRLVLETGDGDSEGDGSVGVGCSSGGCNDNGSFDGDGVPGGVVLRAPEVDDGCGPGSESSVGCTSIKGFSAFGVLVGERDFGKGMAVGSTSVPGGTLFSSSSDSSCAACTSSSPSSSPSPPSGPSSAPCSSSDASLSESVFARNSSICSSPCSPSPTSEEAAAPSSSSSSSTSPPRGTSTNDEVDEDKLLNELAAETT